MLINNCKKLVKTTAQKASVASLMDGFRGVDSAVRN